jgi:hypothetical protein
VSLLPSRSRGVAPCGAGSCDFYPATAGRSRRAALAIAGIILLLIVGSGAAVAAGWFSEVFRVGPLSAAASRPVSLQEARVAQLPLPRSNQLPGGWAIDQVQLTMTPEWRSVDVQYTRAGRDRWE